MDIWPLWNSFSVVKVTLELQMLSVMPISHHATQPPKKLIQGLFYWGLKSNLTKSKHRKSAIIPIRPPPQPLKIMNIGHHAYQRPCPSASMPISYYDLTCAYQPFDLNSRVLSLLACLPCMINNLYGKPKLKLLVRYCQKTAFQLDFCKL